MVDNNRIAVPWADLLPELVESIGKCLDTEIDVLRFRAVCRLWRSSRPPPKRFPCGGVVLPYPFRPGFSDGSSYFTLVERIVYRIELPDRSRPPNFWLLKVERLSDDKLRILNPASHHQIQILPGIQMPRELNALDFRVSEVCKAYDLKCVNSPVFRRNGEYGDSKKVVYRKGVEDGHYFVVAIDTDYKLWYINSGDDRWTTVPTNGMSDNYVDLVNLKGVIYGIDDLGRIWGFDSKFEPKMFADSTLHASLERNLVESFDGKKLSLVEKVTGSNICSSPGGLNRMTSYLVSEAVLGFRIWELNRRGREWCGANPWNGLIIFVGDDCSFSFSSNEFDGRNGYRVFYTNKYISFQTQEEMGPPRPIDLECNCCRNCQNVVRAYKAFDTNSDVKLKFRGLQGHNTGVCDFVTSRTGSLLLHNEFADILWPPPSWLSSP